MKKRKVYHTNVYFQSEGGKKSLEFWDENSVYYKEKENMKIVLLNENFKNVCLGGEAYYTVDDNVIYLEGDGN